MNEAVFNLLCPFQLEWLRDESPLSIAQKSRRIGWTWVQALRAVLDAIEGRHNYYHSSADLTASIEFIEYCAEWAGVAKAVAEVTDETEVIDDEMITMRVMRFASGKKIVAGSSNPTFFRSKGGAVGLDEFAFHPRGRELYKAAHATAMFWGYPMRLWSTHNGEDSYFNTLIRQAGKGELKARVHTVTILDAVEQGIVERIIMRKKKLDHVPAVDTGARKAWLEDLRSTCPDEATWSEEYLCQPSDSKRALLAFDLITACEDPGVNLVEEPEQLSGCCYCGYDVGRSHDLSVLWALERVGDVYWTRMVKALKGAKFPQQADLINRTMANPAVKRLSIDKGLIGLQLAEDAQDRWGNRVEGVQLGPAVQGEAAMLVLGSMEDRRIRLPAVASIRAALHKPKRVMVGGNVRMETPRDAAGHCDEFWGLCLARLAAQDQVVMPTQDQVDRAAEWMRS